MALPQHLVKDVGGTLYTDELQRPANAVVTVCDGAGATLISNANASIDTVATVLMAAATAGDTSVTVNSVTGISSGVEFWIRSPDEKVRCKSVLASAITLWHPILQNHSNAVSVEGTRVSYAVPAANATQLFWDGRVDWCFNSLTHSFTAVECTRYPLERRATIQDVYAEHPLANQIVDAQQDAERWLDTAHEDVLSEIGGKARARVFTGSREFIRATVMMALRNHYRRQAGDAAGTLFERYRDEAKAEIDRIVQIVPRDEDQDGAITAAEKQSSRSVPLYRR